MCGICGLLALSDSRPPDRGLVERMDSTLLHRGPDAHGVYADGPLTMAMRRLSIIDVEGGDQPLGNEDGSIQLMQNGEIYNYRELTDDLRARGHSFATHSDTEVIAHLYEEHGLDFAERLRGMFAISLWDSRRRRLVLARDPYGIKPLYYSEIGGTLGFASELKALLEQPGFSRELDLGAVDAYLGMNFVPGPRTAFAAAKKLPPGHLLIAEDGKIELRRFARPSPAHADELRDESAGELEAELRDRLRDSVRAHLVSDVPVGVLLSGGIDSGALTALATNESEAKMHSFTIGFPEKAFSEVDQARAVAEHFGTEHHELVVRPDAAELLPELVASFDEPFADTSALPTYLLTRLAAEHVKVVLSGEGGDELFGGYFFYLGDVHADRFAGLARLARPAVERLGGGSSNLRLDDRLKRFVRGAGLEPVDRHAAWSQVFGPEARAELLRPNGVAASAGPDVLAAHRRRYAETAGAEHLSRMQDIDLGIYMVDDILVKTDRTSMAHSLEVRVPFLDPAVTDLALRLPAKHKVRGLTKKRLFRRAIAPLVPREVVRARKRGFAMPAAAWLRGELLPFAREVLSPSRVKAQGILDPPAVTATIETHVSGREDLSRNIWGLICFSLWLDRYGGSSASG